MRLRIVSASLIGALFALAFSGVQAAAKTVAPPELQKTLLDFFPKNPQCGESVDPKVLSSKQSANGEAEELWQARTCDTHTKIRYLFRFAPGKDGTLKIVGFERAR